MDTVFRSEPYARHCEATVVAAGPDGIVLDRTVFYPAGGGQPGDSGRIVAADGRIIEIAEAIKGTRPDDVLHPFAPGAPALEVGERVRAEIDWARRFLHMRVHTCLHLLCASVEGGVTGGQIGAGKGRLDFDVPNTALDKTAIEARINMLIAEDHPVRDIWISDEELARNPDLVRTMSVKPPTGSGRVRLVEIGGGEVDLQPCGGTHVRSTSEIGAIAVTKIENKGRHNRRINIALLAPEITP